MTAPLALRSLPLFNVLSAVEIKDITPHLQSGLTAPGTTLIAAGELRPPLIVVRQGQVSLSRPGEQGRTLMLDQRDGPCVVGETEMLAARPALVEVRAQTAVQYIALSADAIDYLCAEQRSCIDKILGEVVALMRYHSTLLEARLKQRTALRPLRAVATRRTHLRRAICYDGPQER